MNLSVSWPVKYYLTIAILNICIEYIDNTNACQLYINTNVLEVEIKNYNISFSYPWDFFTYTN